MKTIQYKTRNTTATTIYVDMTTPDYRYVKDAMQQVIDFTKHCNSSLDATSRIIGAALTKKQSTLPRLGDGKTNSIESASSGILGNLAGSQYTLSIPQLDLITKSFAMLHELVSEWEEIKFTEVRSLPKVVTLTKEEYIEQNPEEETPIEQLFEWVMVEPPIPAVYEKRISKK